jgi:hypothetical protein
MRVRVYADNHDDRFLNALRNDRRRFAIALYQGKQGNGDTYKIVPVNVERFKQLAAQHGCTVVVDIQEQGVRTLPTA